MNFIPIIVVVVVVVVVAMYHCIEDVSCKDFALSKLKVSFLPENPVHVAVYLQHVLEFTSSCSCVDVAFYGTKFYFLRLFALKWGDIL